VPYKNKSKRLIVNKINSQVSYCNQIGLSNLQTQHILSSQSYSCFAGSNITVMVIITLKTILNEKVGYHLARWQWRSQNETEEAMAFF